MSYPGQTATLVGGIVYVPQGSDYVTITGVHINTRGATQPGVQIDGANDALTYSDITNQNSRYSCVMLGSDTGYGRAVNTLVGGNVIHQCGYSPDAPNQDHGIYVDNVVGATITNNLLWGIPYGWAVHVYPDAQNTQVTHNVMDGNGGGVIFGGNSYSTSNNNVAAYNLITNSTRFYGVQDWWGGAVGTGNIAKDNCINRSAAGNIESHTVGFAAENNQFAMPTYADTATHNYSLRPGNPCLALVGYDTAAMLAGDRGSVVARGSSVPRLAIRNRNRPCRARSRSRHKHRSSAKRRRSITIVCPARPVGRSAHQHWRSTGKLRDAHSRLAP